MNEEILAAIDNLQNSGCDSEDIARVLREMFYGLQRGYLGCHMNCVCNDIISDQGARDWWRDWEDEP
jgi:hypothetical protein